MYYGVNCDTSYMMNAFEYLESKYPDCDMGVADVRTWRFYTITEYAAMLNAVVSYLIEKGYVEVLTGMMQHDYYGYMFVKKGSHISVSTKVNGFFDKTNMTIEVKQLYVTST
jgi:hypothetical protein